MDAEMLEQQVASVERGIAFLQHEHLAMLNGLHREITHLKRRCHELSCELDSRFPDRHTAGEEAQLAARCEAAERLLERQQRMTVSTRSELRAGRARASALGRSLREEERRFLEELKRRSHKITLLNRELHLQNVATMSLCHELQGERLKLQSRTAAGHAPEARGEAGRGGKREDEGLLLTPEATAAATSSDQQVAKRHRHTSVREERVRACVPLERVTSPQSPHPMPDPALFLVPLRYRLLRLNQPGRTSDGDGGEDEWEDIEDSRVHRRVDMGAAEGETAL